MSVEEARRLVGQARQLVAFTGAGISTPSGIPDFRGPGGIWSRYQPVEYDEFVASEDARRRYWDYKRATLREFAAARPNVVHETLAGWERDGRSTGVVTQNIDGLHQAAGSRVVHELHGTNMRVQCLGCRKSWPTTDLMPKIEAESIPLCGCGGLLKPATVMFGEALPRAVLEASFALATSCDVLLALGSSLQVYPAAGIPQIAAQRGAAVIIVNREPTPLDGIARVALHGAVEEIVPSLAAVS